MVRLSHAHIIIPAAMADDLFPGDSQVNWVYYPQRKTLLIASKGDTLFASLHKTATTLLKVKNGQGDRSVDIRGLLIDEGIDDADRELAFNQDKAMHVLHIVFR